MSSDTGSPLAVIKAIYERHLSALEPFLPPKSIEGTTHVFDPRALRPSQRALPQANIAQRVSSWGLPEPLSVEITAFLSNESSRFQALAEQTRRELLGQLINASVSSNPSAIPSLVESTCAAVYQSSIESVLHAVQKQVENFNLNDVLGSEGNALESDEDEDTSASDEDDEVDAEDDEAPDENDQDEDNSPIRPGEEVPPLETKFLPIFEALHERGKVLTKPEKTYLVNMTGMTYRQITIWFQNRRRGELKEDQARATSSFTASAPSDEPSDSSDDEFGLEKRVSNLESDATFNIRSWCLASAAAAKSDSSFPSLPTSPIKFGFGTTENAPEFDSDDSDLSDTDDEMDGPPGLRVPSLTTSATTLDSNSDYGRLMRPSAPTSSFVNAPGAIDTHSRFRPIKNLPASRRSTPPATSQTRGTFSFSLNLDDASAVMRYPAHVQPEAGSLATREPSAELDHTPPASAGTPGLAPHAVSALPDGMAPAPSAVPPPSGASAGSPRHISPTPSSHSSSSPRPIIKPLPRRTGCAPRPRPPPRVASASTQIQTPSSSNSARPSIILPPSSNPSLTSTTLSALLRPNPPGPAISPEMEVRLSAMAGRMGVGANTSPESVSKSRSAGVSPVRSSIAGHGNLPNRGTSFSFASATLPKLASLSESTQASSSGPSSFA